MKLLNSVKSISSNLSLKDGWRSVSLEKASRSGYLIGLKLKENNIKSITFRTGIDSGVKDLILVTGNFTLRFDTETAETEEGSKMSALLRYSDYPSSFYYKIATITYQDGTTLSNFSELVAQKKTTLDIALNIIED